MAGPARALPRAFGALLSVSAAMGFACTSHEAVPEASPGAASEPPPKRRGGPTQPASPAPAAQPEGKPSSPDAPSPSASSYPPPDSVVVAALEDPGGRAMETFFEALDRLPSASPGSPDAIVRVAHWGDSAIGEGAFPEALGSRARRRFGDGGPGFIPPQGQRRAIAAKGVATRSDGRWRRCAMVRRCRKDGRYGIAGEAFRASAGARAIYEREAPPTAAPDWARAELWFGHAPSAGGLQVTVDTLKVAQIDADDSTRDGGWFEVELGPASRRVELRAQAGAPTLIYGLVIEAAGPGIVWDAYPMPGAFTSRLLEWDPSHIEEQVAHRQPKLLVMQYGGNDLQRLLRGTAPDVLRRELDEALPRVRAGAPQASCLVVGVIDHGRSGDLPATPDALEALVGIQRDRAFAHGCAFFDARGAMGGANSFREWRARGLMWGDLAHLNPRGHAVMADRLWAAIDRARAKRGEPAR